MSGAEWSVRTLLSPVIARLVIYGVHPIEIERVVAGIESTPLRGATDLETRWLEAWQTLAECWDARAAQALTSGHRTTASVMATNATGCRLAMFLINTRDLVRKREIYESYARSYCQAAECFDPPARLVAIPFDRERSMSAMLHLPAAMTSPAPCVAIMAGLGSCKEEMHVLARAMVQRGIAALVPDMPGCGESLFSSGITCSGPMIEQANRAIADYVANQPELDASRFGACGLCQGGVYAYRAASQDPRYRFCTTLFPLSVGREASMKMPQWMRSGPWFQMQIGDAHPGEVMQQLCMSDDDAVTCPYFLVHGRHDNWMPLEKAQIFFERAHPDFRQQLVIEEEPMYSKGSAATHTMPVGEQLHWVAPVVGDWIVDQTKASSLGALTC